MEQIITLTIELVVLIFALLAGRYLIPFLKTKLDANNLLLISAWALKFVKTAENKFLGEKKGNEKREQVTIWIKEKAEEIGIKLTEDQIRTLLEDAYTTMMQEYEKNKTN